MKVDCAAKSDKGVVSIVLPADRSLIALMQILVQLLRVALRQRDIVGCHLLYVATVCHVHLL